MPYTTGTFPSLSPARPALRTDLAAAGFTLVTQDFAFQLGGGSIAATLDVYRSPAASNAEQKDWYLGLIEYTSGTLRYLSVTVMEGWDDVAKQGTKYAPLTNNVAPAADGSIGDTAAGPAAFGYREGNLWVDDGGTAYRLTADPNRVILNANTSYTTYAGILDRMHPPSVDAFPLVAMGINLGNTGSQTTHGVSTREPGQGAAGTYNFRVQFNGQLAVDRLFSPSYFNSNETISGRQTLSPAVVHPSRSPYNGARGLLRGLKMGTATVGATDTLTETTLDGTTRTYYAAYANIALFVPAF